jgi:hypothetical protein
MLEIVFLAIVNGLVNWGLRPIIVTRAVAADGDMLRGLLADPAGQWRLAAGVARIGDLQPAGDRCEARLRLPLGVRPHASVRVKPSRSGRVLTTEVELGRRTVAWATWILTPGRGTTEVDVAVQPESRGLATRLALLLGGRRWIARRLDIALATLATTAARVAEELVAPPALDAPASMSARADEPTARAATPAGERARTPARRARARARDRRRRRPTTSA